MQARAGDHVDQVYVLEAPLGAGSVGKVFRAWHRLSKRTVALKLLEQTEGDSVTDESMHSARSGTISSREGLAGEFQTLASLHHPNVIQVLDYGFDPTWGSYFTMELVPSATTIVEACKNAESDTKVELLAQLLRGVAYLHRRGVVHSDLKPANVLLFNGQVKIVDFGVALEGPADTLRGGTPGYLAPEVTSGKAPSAASDLFAIGIIACQLLTGVRPGECKGGANRSEEEEYKDDLEPPTAALSDLAVMPELGTLPAVTALFAPDDHLGSWVARLIAPSPAERYTDALQALDDLRTLSGVPLARETDATRESFLQAATLVGREHELSTLFAALFSARRGRGSAWLVGGESGVGKSRLLQEVHTKALVTECRVVRGQAISEGGHAFEVWLPILRELCLRVTPNEDEASVLRALIPDLPELMGVDPAAIPAQVEVSRARLFASLEGLLLRVPRPFVVVLEDLQWAGPDSLALLDHLTPLAASNPLLLLGTYRSDEVPELPLTLPAMQVISLSRLDIRSIASLCTAMLGAEQATPELVNYLAAETEGNSFFLVEIVRALAEDAGELAAVHARADGAGVMTNRITGIVDRRVRQITGDAWTWLEAAALLGRQIDLAVMGQLFPGANLEAWLLECANASVLDAQEGGWRFAHDKLRAHVVHSLPEARRRKLHHDLAAALGAVYGQQTNKQLSRAFHHEHAGEVEAAMMAYLAAADQAAQLNIDAEARHLYQHALALQGQLPLTVAARRQRVDILIKWVTRARLADAPAVNLARLTEAEDQLAIISRQGDGPERQDQQRSARILMAKARLNYTRGCLRQTFVHLDDLRALAEALGNDGLLTLHAFAAGQTAYHMGDHPAVLRYNSEACLAELERRGLHGEKIRGMSARIEACFAMGSLAYPEASSQFEQLRREARALRNPIDLVIVEFHKIPLDVLAGANQAAAFRGLVTAETELRAVREPIYDYMLANTRAIAGSRLGQADNALASIATARRLAQAMGSELYFGDLLAVSEAESMLHLGKAAEALQFAEASVAVSKADVMYWSWAWGERIWAGALARLEPHAHEVIDAHLNASIEISARVNNLLDIAQTHLWWAEIARDRGDMSTAHAHARRALVQYERSQCTDAMAKVQALFSHAADATYRR